MLRIIIGTLLITTFNSGNCSKHQSFECNKTKKAVQCGNNTLSGKHLWREMRNLTLTKLTEDDILNKTLRISVNDKLQVIDNTALESLWLKIELRYPRDYEAASHVMFASSDEITFFKDQQSVHGYISHYITTRLYKGSSNEKYDLEALRFETVAIKIDFIVADDRTIGVFSTDEGYITIRHSLNLSCVQFTKKRHMESCIVLYSNVSFVSCKCHFHGVDSFTIAVKTTIAVLPHSEHTLFIYFISTFVSSTFLLVTLTLYLWFQKSLKSGNGRFKIQVNLAVSFLLRHITILAGLGLSVFDPPDRSFCNVMAILNLYFIFTSVLWVLLEGVMIYRKVCKSEIIILTRNIIIATVIIWIIPLFLVGGISAFEIPKDTFLHITEPYRVIQERLIANYNDETTSTAILLKERKYSFCVTMAFPVLILESVVVSSSILINIVILIWVGTVVWRIQVANNKNSTCEAKSGFYQVVNTFRAVAILTTVLGLPWLFSLLYILITDIEKTNSIVPTAVEFFFLFLQGPALFYFYCIKSTEFRHAFKKRIAKNKLKREVGKPKLTPHLTTPI